MSAFDAPFLTEEDLKHARHFANLIEKPQDDMPSRWIRGLVATVEHGRDALVNAEIDAAEAEQERDQALIRAEAAEAELEAYRRTERKATATSRRA